MEDRSYEAAERALSAMISGKVRGQGGKPWENYFDSMFNYLEVRPRAGSSSRREGDGTVLLRTSLPYCWARSGVSRILCD
jgi:hypothetical protein